MVVALLVSVYMAITWFYPFTVFNPVWMLIVDEGHHAAMRNGPREIEPVGQFVSVFPTARHTITHYTGQMGPSAWTSEVGIHGRYVLTIHVDIEFDWTRRHIRSHSEPRYYLQEITSVTGPPGGPYRIGREPSTDRKFGREEWERLYLAGGDLSVLGVNVVTDRPVANFGEAWDR